MVLVKARLSVPVAVLASMLGACSSAPLDMPSNEGGDASAPQSGADAGDWLARAMTAATCFDIEDLYGRSLAAEQTCDPGGAADQCLVTVRLSLPCGCTTTVNDATESNAIAEVWLARGCSSTERVVCPEGCVVFDTTNPCKATGVGGGVCVPLAPPHL
ncbi:MAG TPA: hypothetical protein VHL80_02495 [Polyangia bacterium]|nr:hypothetical protein [Polyangia bacterium]